MTKIVVWRGQSGELEGYSDKDKRAFRRLRKLMENLAVGELFEIDAWFPRSGPYHRMHMKMEATLFENQDRFTSFKWFRDWLKVGAGHADLMPGALGEMVAVPRSIDYKSMDDEEIRAFHEDVKAFMYTEHAIRFLWPHLSAEQGQEMVDALLFRF